MTKLGVCSQQALRAGAGRPHSRLRVSVLLPQAGCHARAGDRQEPPVGQPVTVEPAKLDYAAHLRAIGRTRRRDRHQDRHPRTSLYRHLPPRPPDPVTAGELPAAVVS